MNKYVKEGISNIRKKYDNMRKQLTLQKEPDRITRNEKYIVIDTKTKWMS